MEQEQEDIRVLVLDDVLNDLVGCTDLVALKSNVQGSCNILLRVLLLLVFDIEVVVLFASAYLVEYGVLGAALVYAFDVREESVDASAVEREDAHHICDIELHEGLEEQGWLGLEIDQLDNQLLVLAGKYALEKYELDE